MDNGPTPRTESLVNNCLHNTSLLRQFEKRQAAFKANMDIVEDAPLYRVDGYLTGEYEPPSPTNEHQMECFETWRWQYILHDNDSDCKPADPPPRPPLLGGPRPPLIIPYECGAIECLGDVTTFAPGRIISVDGAEWCLNPAVPKVNYEPQSTIDYQNGGVFDEDC